MISTMPISSTNFEIEATTQEVVHLRKIFDKIYSANLGTLARVFKPFIKHDHDDMNAQ